MLLRTTSVALCLFLVACDGDPDIVRRPDAGPGEDAGRVIPDAGGGGETIELPGPTLDRDVCGAIRVDGSLEIPAGTTVTICAGSVLEITSDAAITVEGTLRLMGSADARITVAGRRWSGFVVNGALEADFVDVYDAQLALSAAAGSTVRFDDGYIDARATNSARFSGDATLDRTRIFGGSTIPVGSGAVLRMTDSVVDLDHPTTSPDCTSVSGGQLLLDHVQFTGCHCPLHINSGSGPMMVTNSVFDGASIPMMIRSATGTFTGNVFDGTGSGQLQDIGGGIDVDVAGNWYGADAPVLDTTDESQFRNAADVLAERPADAGPRL